MHGPWHTPEHPDERDASHEEEAAELRRLEAFAEDEDTSAEGCPILTLEPGVICDACDCWKGMEAERLSKNTEKGAPQP